MDHSFAEILIDRRWHRIDSYIVDRQLADTARTLLRADERSIGYGVHVNGVSAWSGERSAYSQSHNDGSVSFLITTDYGTFDDVGRFYAFSDSNNRLSLIDRLLFGMVSRKANQRIEALRYQSL